MTVGWYRLVDIFGLKALKGLITEDVLNCVWVDELRAQYTHTGEIIGNQLTESHF